jgi:hypothetical protein
MFGEYGGYFRNPQFYRFLDGKVHPFTLGYSKAQMNVQIALRFWGRAGNNLDVCTTFSCSLQSGVVVISTTIEQYQFRAGT